MRFAGRVSAANYITAGANAAKQSSDMAATARENAPNYTEQVTESIKQQALNYDNAVKNSAEITNAGTTAQGGVAVTKADIEVKKASAAAKKGVAKGQMLAKAGGLLAAGLQKPIEKPFREQSTEGLEGLESTYLSRIAKARGMISEIESETFEMPDHLQGTPSSSSTPSQNGGETASTNSGSQPTSSYQATGPQGKYSVADMTQFALDAGFTPDKAKIMGAIGMAESGGNATIDTSMTIDPDKSDEYSIGLFQVNAQAHGDKLQRLGYTEDDLRDPRKAAQVAKMVYDEVGSFKPWTVYDSGKYLRYLQ